jgi:hypothetical protein
MIFNVTYFFKLGINVLKLSFSNWHWIYGKTPSFVVNWPFGDQKPELQIVVQYGIIESLHILNNTIDRKYSEKLTELLLHQKLDNNLYNSIISSCVFKNMKDSYSNLKEILLLLCSTSVS